MNHYCIVILQNKKVLVVPEMWVQSKNRRSTKIFLSGDENKVPDFDIPVKYFIQDDDACYNGFLVGDNFRKYQNL